MPAPLVSVIIDNYNYGRFLCEAIDSALNQTYSKTEIIVVDDGSVDDSRHVIASYGARIRPVLKENGGQASAFNAGFAASRGELVCFLDADDVWLPDKLQAVVTTSSTRPEAGFIYHTYKCADAALRPVGKALPARLLDGNVRDSVLRSGGCWSFPPPSAFAFRRSVLESCMPIPEHPFRICADACLAYLVPLLVPIAGIAEPLCLYRIHGSNAYSSLTTNGKPACETHAIRSNRYRANVEGTNQVLAQLGLSERLCLQDHSDYLWATYFGHGSARPSWGRVSWSLARIPSQPSWFVRSKLVVKFWLEATQLRQRS